MTSSIRPIMNCPALTRPKSRHKKAAGKAMSRKVLTQYVQKFGKRMRMYYQFLE